VVNTGNDIWDDLVGVLGEGDVGSDMANTLAACGVLVVCCKELDEC
jgi:phosphoglycerate dehydrogenase-like enzyme